MKKKSIKVGDVFNKLKIIKIFGRKNTNCKCLCNCGKIKVFYKSHLLNKHNTSCGSKECTTRTKHGITKTRFYKKWEGINGRCYRKTNDSYYRYGGKGIRSSWKKDFMKFYNEMYDSYLEHVKLHGVNNTWIDRIDNNKDYCKENCKWSTAQEQAKNRSNVILIEINGEKLPLAHIEKKFGIRKMKLQNLLKRNWTLEEIKRGVIEGVFIKKLSKKENMPHWHKRQGKEKLLKDKLANEFKKQL